MWVETVPAPCRALPGKSHLRRRGTGKSRRYSGNLPPVSSFPAHGDFPVSEHSEGSLFHCASSQHSKGKAIHQETPAWQPRLGVCKLACLGVTGNGGPILGKRSSSHLVLVKCGGTERSSWIHSPSLIGTTILAFYSWAMALQSQGCTMQQYSKVKDRKK